MPDSEPTTVSDLVASAVSDAEGSDPAPEAAPQSSATDAQPQSQATQAAPEAPEPTGPTFDPLRERLVALQARPQDIEQIQRYWTSAQDAQKMRQELDALKGRDPFSVQADSLIQEIEDPDIRRQHEDYRRLHGDYKYVNDVRAQEEQRDRPTESAEAEPTDDPSQELVKQLQEEVNQLKADARRRQAAEQRDAFVRKVNAEMDVLKVPQYMRDKLTRDCMRAAMERVQAGRARFDPAEIVRQEYEGLGAIREAISTETTQKLTSSAPPAQTKQAPSSSGSRPAYRDDDGLSTVEAVLGDAFPKAMESLGGADSA